MLEQLAIALGAQLDQLKARRKLLQDERMLVLYHRDGCCFPCEAPFVGDKLAEVEATLWEAVSSRPENLAAEDLLNMVAHYFFVVSY